MRALFGSRARDDGRYKDLQYSFRVTTAAALVLAVMTSPMRPAKSAGSYCFNHQRRDFDVTSAHSFPRLASALADSRPVQVKALPLRA